MALAAPVESQKPATSVESQQPVNSVQPRKPTALEAVDGQAADADRLVLDHLGLARKLAFKYSGRGEPVEELIQVAMVGLVQAAHRFDPERGSPFVSYAIPTILGEIRRHFRDHTWAVHIPRPVHDLYHAILQADDRLAGKLQRSPTVRELAAELEVSEEEVIEAQESGSAYRALSLDSPTGDSDDDGHTLGDLIGGDDTALERVDNREAVRRVLPHVPFRERRILHLRFFKDRTQAQIAEELGMSQMHVSRLLTMTLAKIREAALEEDATGAYPQWPTPRTRRKAS